MSKRSDPDTAAHVFRELVEMDGQFTEVADRALELGVEYLGVKYGHMARVVPDLGYWEAIASTDDADGPVPVGTDLELRTTFCRHAIEREETLAVHDVPCHWGEDVAYERHGWECYTTTPITVSGELYGTLCFADETPREDPFEGAEVAFLDSLVGILESKLERRRTEIGLESRNRLIDVFGRVLRHNLRNDLTVVRGHVELLLEQLEDADVDPTQVQWNIDRIISLTEKSNELRRIAEDSGDLHEQSVTSLLREAIASIESTYPDAEVSLHSPEDVHLLAFSTVESGPYELIENAVKHDPRSACEVSVESTDRAVSITVSDEGPGLPEQERRVLQGNPETALSHGSGVGLWIVWWVVENHDGTIEVDVSEEGTAITLTFPRPTTSERLVGDISRE